MHLLLLKIQYDMLLSTTIYTNINLKIFCKRGGIAIPCLRIKKFFFPLIMKLADIFDLVVFLGSLNDIRLISA